MLMMIKRSNRGKLSGSLGGRALPDMRKGTQRKRSLWSLITAAVAIALVGLFTVGTGVSYAATQDAATQDLSEPVHHKTIDKHLVNGKWDGTYDLKLTVKGDSVGSTETNPVDIVVVLDTSGSMNKPYDGKEDSPSKLTMAKNALTNIDNTGLLDKVLGSDGPDGVKVSLVTFDTYASTDDTWYDKNDAQKLKDYVNNHIEADGGTNWEAALKAANTLLNKRKDDGAQKYIVFLSDGNPTYRLSNGAGYKKVHIPGDYQWVQYDNGYWYRVWVEAHDEIVPVTNPDDMHNNDRYQDTPAGLHGSGYDTDGLDEYEGCDKEGNPYTYNWNYSCAADVAESFHMDSKHFFSVKIATEAGKMDALESYATGEKNASALDGTNPTNLSNAFSDIVTEITHSQTYADVTIKDTLSPYAEIVTTPTVSKTDTENVLPAGNVAQVDGSKVTWDIKEGGKYNDLEKGATYTLSINVRPNQSAYDSAMAGECHTGVIDAAGTVGEGIYSNDNTNTSLSYSTVKYTNGDGKLVPHGSLAYEQPVMVIPLSSITVTKNWETTTSTPDTPASVTVKLQWKVKGEQGEKWEDVKDSNGIRTLKLNKGNEWTDVFNNIAAGPDGHEYRVVEIDPDPDSSKVWTTSYTYSLKKNSYYDYETNKSNVNEKDGIDVSITLAGRQKQAASAKVTNKQNTRMLTITKSVTGNFGDTSKAFRFKLTDASGSAITNFKKVTGDTGTSADVSLEADGSFKLKNSERLVVELPYGASYKVVEYDPKEGTNDTVDYTTTIDESGDAEIDKDTPRTASSPEGGITKDTTIAYTNKRDVTPDVGVDLGSGAPYAAVFGGAGLAGVIWMVLKRRNSLGI
jgi:hypothetical protein